MLEVLHSSIELNEITINVLFLRGDSGVQRLLEITDIASYASLACLFIVLAALIKPPQN
jgi:hypothetical protein